MPLRHLAASNNMLYVLATPMIAASVTRTITVSEIMTENPDTLTPDDFAMEALDVMQSRHFRHLPVTDGSKVIGMVSIRDLFAAVKMSLEEDVQETEAFVFGKQYGA